MDRWNYIEGLQLAGNGLLEGGSRGRDESIPGPESAQSQLFLLAARSVCLTAVVFQHSTWPPSSPTTPPPWMAACVRERTCIFKDSAATVCC